MKMAFVSLLTLSLGTLTSCGPLVKIEGSFEMALNISELSKLIVETGSGDIHIIRGEDNQIFISARFIVQAPGAETAHKLAEQLKIDPPIKQQDNIIRVGDLHNYGLGLGVSCNILETWSCFGASITMSFTIQVPYTTEVALDSGSGDLIVSGIRGPVHINTGSGDVEISGVEREVIAKVGSGGIKVAGAAKVNIDIGSGRVALSKIREDVKVDVGSGNVSLEDIGGDIAVSTGSGNVRLNSNLGASVRWHLSTGSGHVQLALPPDARFVITAKVSSGEIEMDFPLAGKIRKRELRGTVGESPEAEIHIKTSSGDIRIKKKDASLDSSN